MEFFWNFYGFLGILWDFHRFYVILLGFLWIFIDLFWDFLRFFWDSFVIFMDVLGFS